MSKISKNDFVSVEYTGKIKETGQVFDTTDEAIAKKEKIYSPKASYGPITICIGQNHVLPGIDDAMVGKEENEEFLMDLEAERAFGKKSAKLLRLVPSNIFKKQGIQPFVGLEVQLDSTPGIIRSLSGGRIMVDFNHPLAGKDLSYEIKINKKVTDTEDKIGSFIKMTLGVREPKVSIKEKKAEIEMSLPPQISKLVVDKLKELVPEITTIDIISKEKDKKNKT